MIIVDCLGAQTRTPLLSRRIARSRSGTASDSRSARNNALVQLTSSAAATDGVELGDEELGDATSGDGAAVAGSLSRIRLAPTVSTTRCKTSWLPSMSIARLTSTSCVVCSGIVWPVVAVGSSATLSRPTRITNFASDEYDRGYNATVSSVNSSNPQKITAIFRQ